MRVESSALAGGACGVRLWVGALSVAPLEACATRAVLSPRARGRQPRTTRRWRRRHRANRPASTNARSPTSARASVSPCRGATSLSRRSRTNSLLTMRRMVPSSTWTKCRCGMAPHLPALAAPEASPRAIGSESARTPQTDAKPRRWANNRHSRSPWGAPQRRSLGLSPSYSSSSRRRRRSASRLRCERPLSSAAFGLRATGASACGARLRISLTRVAGASLARRLRVGCLPPACRLPVAWMSLACRSPVARPSLARRSLVARSAPSLRARLSCTSLRRALGAVSRRSPSSRTGRSVGCTT